MNVNAKKVFDGLVKAVGKPDLWVNNCYFMACQAVEKCGVPGTTVYGMYTGKVAPGTPFHSRASELGLVRHGWVKLEDGRVLDPTRWVFEGKEPYIFIGTGHDYDEGANKLRAATMRSAPEWDPEEKQVYFNGSSDAWVLIEKLLGLQNALEDNTYKPGNVSVEQCFWLANCPPQMLGVHIREVYEWLDRNELRVAIPVDNWRMVMRAATT